MRKQPRFAEKVLRRGSFAATVLAVAAMGLAGSAHGQSFTEFPPPTAGGGPSGITAGPDGNLWFTEYHGNKVGRITTAGVITEFSIPTPYSGPISIAAGPDGNLWFTESSGNKIGRITTSGVITEFTARASPWDIAAGPDGNLWFTEPGYYGRNVGRITTDGVITEFSVSLGSLSIAAAPDGNLWFTEGLGNKVGRITPSGVLTEFMASGNLGYITAGPDGALWFTEHSVYGDKKIGRITTAGVLTEFAIAAGFMDLGVIAAGPDGNLWFAELHPTFYSSGLSGQSLVASPDYGDKIVRITPAGVITEFSIRTDSQGPLSIAAGPDGNLWFTTDRSIVRLNLAALCAPSATSLCLNNARFRVETTWTTKDGASGSGQAVGLTPDSGYFWFFSPNNPEVLVKALNGCSLNNRNWIFGAGLTNVNVVLKVTDTQTGQVKTYTNPQGAAILPIQDTNAFACP